MSDGRTERDALSRKGDVRAHREELQRVQIGLVGLAAVLLVVTLANLIVDAVRKDGGSESAATSADVPSASLQSGGNSAASQASTNNEPLADLGVTPTTPESSTPILPSPVPDLEPDPQLRERMDQDREQPQSQSPQTP
ncbi:MAG: hypothetical protein KKD64_09365 [Alphaproteobacteria bacterium]|nr:hypothetical protein [Alphaproteobacteria bacterium]MBU0792881.1 hypothetical protein [Alphaproteobacteria bacterium]MBU0874538.1 hypothetical protein [Alphaproteobacteria bacterium]MBU1769851.1 hypothetical protein [Alphaproteobacteria bacterium]